MFRWVGKRVWKVRRSKDVKMTSVDHVKQENPTNSVTQLEGQKKVETWLRARLFIRADVGKV